MKYLIVSDIHGSSFYANKIKEIFEKENPDKLILLGDLYYHGPRNPLTREYNPMEVSNTFNSLKDNILCARGNCDAEVDQMVLDFPIMADYCYLSLDGLSVFATHGHHFNTQTPPPLREGEILLHGHTHVLKCEEFGHGNYYLNPGSTTYPKEGNPKTYMVYENKCFTVKELDGRIIFTKQF